MKKEQILLTIASMIMGILITLIFVSYQQENEAIKKFQNGEYQTLNNYKKVKVFCDKKSNLEYLVFEDSCGIYAIPRLDKDGKHILKCNN